MAKIAGDSEIHSLLHVNRFCFNKLDKCMHRNSLRIWQPGVAMSGRAGRPSSASPAQAPAPSWRGSRRRCGWWPSRSWPRRKSNPRTKEEEIHLTRKMMIGEMMRTRSRIAIPSACCWFAVFNSLSTVSLYKRENHDKLIPCSKLTRDVFSVLSKRSSASQCSQRWPHSTEKEGYVWLGVERRFLLGSHHGSFRASWNMDRIMKHRKPTSKASFASGFFFFWFSTSSLNGESDKNLFDLPWMFYLLVSINEKLVSLFICS